MTTFKVPPSEEDTVFDLMAELDSELKPEKKAKQKRVAAPVPAPFVQQWFPFGVKFLLRHQMCDCGAEFQNVEGLYLVDTTKNGAMRSTRHEGKLAAPYKHFAPTTETHGTEQLLCCPWCYAPEPMPETPHTEVPARPLSVEDREALKELDETLGDM